MKRHRFELENWLCNGNQRSCEENQEKLGREVHSEDDLPGIRLSWNDSIIQRTKFCGKAMHLSAQCEMTYIVSRGDR